MYNIFNAEVQGAAQAYRHVEFRSLGAPVVSSGVVGGCLADPCGLGVPVGGLGSLLWVVSGFRMRVCAFLGIMKRLQQHI